MEACKECELVNLSVAWIQVIEDNVAGYLGVLDFGLPVVCVRLRFCEMEGSICLSIVWDDWNCGRNGE